MIAPKTKQLVSYIAKKYGHATITSIMKLAYLIDLIAVKKTKAQFSTFVYRRYLFGPFDKDIYIYLNDLVNDKILKEKPCFAPTGDEYIVYEFIDSVAGANFDQFKETDITLIDSVLDELQGLGAKSLSQIAYATDPMKKLGATMNNRKGLNKVLDLGA